MITRQLYVEKDTESGREAITAMKDSGLEFQTWILSGEDVDRKDCRDMPRILTHEGIFDGLDSIKWYSQIYGVNGPCFRYKN